MPALVIEALRFNMPTNPGQVPLQLATVRIGPRWVDKPGRTWWLYCQTASATMSGALGSRWRKTSMPIFCESMKTCSLAESKEWARTTFQPCLLYTSDAADDLLC